MDNPSQRCGHRPLCLAAYFHPGHSRWRRASAGLACVSHHRDTEAQRTAGRLGQRVPKSYFHSVSLCLCGEKPGLITPKASSGKGLCPALPPKHCGKTITHNQRARNAVITQQSRANDAQMTHKSRAINEICKNQVKQCVRVYKNERRESQPTRPGEMGRHNAQFRSARHSAERNCGIGYCVHLHPVEASSLPKLFRPYAEGLQTLCRK